MNFDFLFIIRQHSWKIYDIEISVCIVTVVPHLNKSRWLNYTKFYVKN